MFCKHRCHLHSSSAFLPKRNWKVSALNINISISHNQAIQAKSQLFASHLFLATPWWTDWYTIQSLNWEWLGTNFELILRGAYLTCKFDIEIYLAEWDWPLEILPPLFWQEWISKAWAGLGRNKRVTSHVEVHVIELEVCCPIFDGSDARYDSLVDL